MLNILPIPATDILLYLNLLFGVMIFLGALIGFIRGTRKSLVHLIVWVILFLIALLTINLQVKAILNFDFSKYNFIINDKQLTTLNSFVQEWLVTQFPEYFTKEMLVEGTNANAFIYGVVMTIFKMAFWIVWLIVSLILSQIIDAIVWSFLKPKKVMVNGKKRAPKKSMGSRLGGLGIGAFRGLLCTLLLGFIFAGLSSIASSIKEIDNENVNVGVICTDDDLVFMDLSNGTKNNTLDSYLDEYGDVIDVLEGYRTTIPGRIFGVLKFGKDKVTIDEALFDSLFKINGKNGTIKIRKEINILAKLLQNDAAKQILTEGFTISDLANLNTDSLRELVDVVSSLDTIKVLVPIGLEIVTYTDILADVLGDQYAQIHQVLLDNINKFNDIDYNKDIQSLGYALVDVVELLGDGLSDVASIDYLNLDVNKVETIFQKLGEMKLLDLVAPVAVSYILSTDYIKNALATAGFTIEDLNIDKVINKENFFTHELLLIPELYKSIVNLGLKIDTNNIDFSEINQDKVDAFVQTLFKFYIVDNSIPVVASTLYVNFVPDNYKDLISAEELKSTNWREELSPVLTAAATLLKTNIINSKDPLTTICEMDDEEFVEIGRYLSKSKLLCNHINDLINILVDNGNIENLKLEGLDSNKNEHWDENEIVSLFRAAKIIINTGIIGAEDPMLAIKSLDDEKIDNLATSLSNSKFFAKNLNPIVNFAIEQINVEGLTLETLDKEKGENWDETELKSLLHAFKTIIDSGIIDSKNPIDTVKDLTDEQIDSLAINLSSSRFFTKNLNNVINYLMKQVELGDITFEGLDKEKGEEWNESELKGLLHSLSIFASTNIIGSEKPFEEIKNINDETIVNLSNYISSSKFMTKNLSPILDYFSKDLEFKISTLNKEEWTNNEIYAVFKSFKTLASTMDEGTFNVETILNLSESDLDIILESKLFRETLKNILVDKSKEGQDLEILKGIYEDDSHYAWNDIRQEVAYSINNNKLIMNEATSSKYIIYKNGIYFASTTNNLFDLSTIDGYVYSSADTFKVEAIKVSGELRNVFNAISCLEIKDIKNVSIDLRNVINNKEILFKSYILVETLVDQIRKQDSVLNIPDEYKENGSGLWRDEDGKVGELNRIFTALDVALGISTSTEPVLIESINVDNISLNNIIQNKDVIFASDIISATIIKTIQDLNNDGTIIVPSEYLGNDYSLWKDKGTKSGELSLVLDALDKTITLPDKGFNVDLQSISLMNIINNKDEILKSALLTATLVDKIIALNGNILTIPNEYLVSDTHIWKTDYTLWKNTYDDNYNSVLTRGELSKLITSLDIALSITESGNEIDLNNITIDNISLRKIVDNKEQVFESVILTATVVEKIKEIENSSIIIPLEYQNGYDLWVGTDNELFAILEALDNIGLIPNNGFDINIDDITISNVIDNKVSILKSAVLTATLVDKVVNLDNTLTITDEYKVNQEHVWETDYLLWKGNDGELSKIFNGLNYALINKNISVNSIGINNISLKNVIVNKNEVFKSNVLSYTIIDKIRELNNNGIIVPKEYIDSYELWIGTDKELNLILDAIDSVDLIPDTGFEINIDDLTIEKIIINKEEILKSVVLSATMIDKVLSLNTVLNIPDKFNVNSNHIWSTDYNEWISTNELSNFISGMDYAFVQKNISVENINVNNVSLMKVVNNKEEVFTSEIFTATIVKKIQELNGVSVVVPLEYQGNYNEWINDHNELFRILDALNVIDLIPESGFNITTDSIDLRKVMVNQDEILKSAVISATIIDKIETLSPTLTIPNDKKVANRKSWINDYGFWKNEYDTSYNNVISYGELAHLLNSIDQILDVSNNSTIVTIDSLNSKLDNIYIEDIVMNRENILKSYIISATLIDKVISLNGAGLVIPDYYNVVSTDDYNKWMNVYSSEILTTRGELDRLLVSVYSALGLSASTKTSIASFNITNSIDTMISSIVLDDSKEYRTNLLGSIVISETIVSQIVAFKSLKSNDKDFIQETEDNQKLLNNSIVLTDKNNRNDWYEVSVDGVVKEKELWNILTSVSILLGKSGTKFSEIDEFTIDTLLTASLIINYDDHYDVITSDVKTLLQSYIMEEVFADVAKSLLTSSSLSTFFDSTLMANFNYYKDSEKVKVYNDEYDLMTFLESFYIMNKYIDYKNLNNNVSNLKELGTDEKINELNDLGAGMVISRVFKASIADIYNALFLVYYTSLVNNNPLIYTTHPYDSLTKFDQSRYNNPITKVEAHDNFVNDYRIISKEYETIV